MRPLWLHCRDALLRAPQDEIAGNLSLSSCSGSDVASVAGATDTESTISTAASLEAPATLPVSPRAGHQSKQGVPQPPQELPSAQDRQWGKEALTDDTAVTAFSDMEGAESKASGYALL